MTEWIEHVEMKDRMQQRQFAVHGPILQPNLYMQTILMLCTDVSMVYGGADALVCSEK